jgi:hypothetical protein
MAPDYYRVDAVILAIPLLVLRRGSVKGDHQRGFFQNIPPKGFRQSVWEFFMDLVLDCVGVGREIDDPLVALTGIGQLPVPILDYGMAKISGEDRLPGITIICTGQQGQEENGRQR